MLFSGFRGFGVERIEFSGFRGRTNRKYNMHLGDHEIARKAGDQDAGHQELVIGIHHMSKRPRV